jgi:hypothetical protein
LSWRIPQSILEREGNGINEKSIIDFLLYSCYVQFQKDSLKNIANLWIFCFEPFYSLGSRRFRLNFRFRVARPIGPLEDLDDLTEVDAVDAGLDKKSLSPPPHLLGSPQSPDLEDPQPTVSPLRPGRASTAASSASVWLRYQSFSTACQSSKSESRIRWRGTMALTRTVAFPVDCRHTDGRVEGRFNHPQIGSSPEKQGIRSAIRCRIQP